MASSGMFRSAKMPARTRARVASRTRNLFRNEKPVRGIRLANCSARAALAKVGDGENRGAVFRRRVGGVFISFGENTRRRAVHKREDLRVMRSYGSPYRGGQLACVFCEGLHPGAGIDEHVTSLGYALDQLSRRLLQRPGLSGPPWYTTWSRRAAAHSVHALAELEPTVLASGHGRPWSVPKRRMPSEPSPSFSASDNALRRCWHPDQRLSESHHGGGPLKGSGSTCGHLRRPKYSRRRCSPRNRARGS